jgi:hypothetical protein
MADKTDAPAASSSAAGAAAESAGSKPPKPPNPVFKMMGEKSLNPSILTVVPNEPSRPAQFSTQTPL